VTILTPGTSWINYWLAARWTPRSIGACAASSTPTGITGRHCVAVRVLFPSMSAAADATAGGRVRAIGAPPIVGKLTAVTNRIVDRGELSMPGEGASLSEHTVVLIRPDAPGSRGRRAREESEILQEPVKPASPLSR
jgi:hypothetical protein